MDKFLERYSSAIEQAFGEYYRRHTSPEHLYQPVHYILSLGGKRPRPALVLLAADSFGCPLEKAMPAAMAIEVFHNFSLVHDDIMDRAPLRRGHPTVHCRWDANTAILSGDVMMIQAYELFESYQGDTFREVILAFNRVARQVCEGQQLDMDYEKISDVSQAQYMEMIRLKTAVLIGGALRIGGIVAGASTRELEALEGFGTDVGLAFQLTDDYLDTFGDPRTFGKRIGGDILEGKKTFLYITARERASQEEFERAFSLAEEEEKIEAVRDLYRTTGADQALREQIDRYTEKALAHVDRLPFSQPYREHYIRLARALVQRKL